MKVLLVIDGKPQTSIELGASEIASVVSNLPDSEEYTTVYQALSAHPSSAVRENVAYKDKLTKAVFDTLINDSAINVVRNAVRNNCARENASTDQLLKAIERDVEAAEAIAGDVTSYTDVDVEKICAALVGHADPKIRRALANNGSAPKRHLKALLKDPDPETRNAAKSSLS